MNQEPFKRGFWLKTKLRATKGFDLAAGESNVSIELTVTAEAVGGNSLKLVNLGNEKNTLSGYFKTVPEGMHTLSVLHILF